MIFKFLPLKFRRRRGTRKKKAAARKRVRQLYKDPGMARLWLIMAKERAKYPTLRIKVTHD